MIKKPKNFLKRLMIIAPIKLFAGSLLFFLGDKILGFAVMVIGLTALIWAIFLYFRIKNNSSININKSHSYFYIVLGFSILFLSLLIFILYGLSEYFRIIIKLIIGFILLFRGIYNIKK